MEFQKTVGTPPSDRSVVGQFWYHPGTPEYVPNFATTPLTMFFMGIWSEAVAINSRNQRIRRAMFLPELLFCLTRYLEAMVAMNSRNQRIGRAMFCQEFCLLDEITFALVYTRLGEERQTPSRPFRKRV